MFSTKRILLCEATFYLSHGFATVIHQKPIYFIQINLDWRDKILQVENSLDWYKNGKAGSANHPMEFPKQMDSMVHRFT